ncbi:DUF2244 domain-containing protein [Aquincola sp. MAHUQ-54]|uniref:DUF2244 domain-containing protein n=1 Tax=Aquincola agrisoli TaxID=3119538 RepID=A0AAW9QEG8_9BURK
MLDIDGVPALQWVLRRNCSLTPRQVLLAYLSVCTVSLGVAGAFAWLGAMPVLVFAGLELLVLGVALLLHARHAGDRETITLSGEALRIEHCCGSSVERMDFRSAWVRVEPVHGEGSLLELSGQGRRMRVGRYVRPELRGSLAQELRLALRAGAATHDGGNDLGMEHK